MQSDEIKALAHAEENNIQYFMASKRCFTVPLRCLTTSHYHSRQFWLYEFDHKNACEPQNLDVPHMLLAMSQAAVQEVIRTCKLMHSWLSAEGVFKHINQAKQSQTTPASIHTLHATHKKPQTSPKPQLTHLQHQNIFRRPLLSLFLKYSLLTQAKLLCLPEFNLF